jgi:hypothetical protein
MQPFLLILMTIVASPPSASLDLRTLSISIPSEAPLATSESVDERAC